jgi:hypothetical protein
MGNLLCMGLFLKFRVMTSPRVLDRADHRLTTGVNVDVLDSDFLLALASMTVQRIEQLCERFQGGRGSSVSCHARPAQLRLRKGQLATLFRVGKAKRPTSHCG